LLLLKSIVSGGLMVAPAPICTTNDLESGTVLTPQVGLVPSFAKVVASI